MEKTVNEFPSDWRHEPQNNEVFQSIDECGRRLIAYSFSQGFDVVKTHSSNTPYPNATFCYIHHSDKTRNRRDLPQAVDRDEYGTIVGARKRELTVVRQMNCTWCCKVAFKFVGKRGKSEKGFVLTVKSTSHSDHPLAANPLVYRQHRERLEAY